MKHKDFDGMNIYDRIAVRAVVAYLSGIDKEERNKIIASMRSDRELFGETIKAAAANFRKNYDRESKNNAYYKYIGADYIRYMDTIESEIYINSVPDVVFDCIKDFFS